MNKILFVSALCAISGTIFTASNDAITEDTNKKEWVLARIGWTFNAQGVKPEDQKAAERLHKIGWIRNMAPHASPYYELCQSAYKILEVPANQADPTDRPLAENFADTTIAQYDKNFDKMITTDFAPCEGREIRNQYFGPNAKKETDRVCLLEKFIEKANYPFVRGDDYERYDYIKDLADYMVDDEEAAKHILPDRLRKLKSSINKKVESSEDFKSFKRALKVVLYMELTLPHAKSVMEKDDSKETEK